MGGLSPLFGSSGKPADVLQEMQAASDEDWRLHFGNRRAYNQPGLNAKRRARAGQSLQRLGSPLLSGRQTVGSGDPPTPSHVYETLDAADPLGVIELPSIH